MLTGAKRLLDIVGAGLLIVLLSPIMLMTAVIIRCKMGGPVIFRQTRPGLNGKPFQMIKFRTMRDDRDTHGNLIPDEKRLTGVGQRLRSLSVDELPELWNVLKGDMSLVGPRPLLVEYLKLYSPEQARRHQVKPGLTGWAQVNGRNALSWEEKFEFDVWYVDNYDLWLDLKILLKTVKHVLRKDGVSADGEATMPVFTGSKGSS